ncbi:MAG TPA: FAD-binding oxidoreductase [Firmicutes bacterium]|nr:FAD-binding oxidoreductase [Bacillota bacterium]
MSQLINGRPYFTSIQTAPCIYPWLSYDESCDVLIIGNGFSAALLAYRFADAGVSVVLAGTDPAGYGGTALSGGILLYETENNLSGLMKQIGRENAVQVYKMQQEAIGNLENLALSFPAAGFTRRDGFYYTNKPEQADQFHTEYLMRRHNGFDVTYIDRDTAMDRFSFPVQAGILSKGLAGEIDSYLFMHALLAAAEKRGARIYENTPVQTLFEEGDGVFAETTAFRKIRAKKAILATGLAPNKNVWGISSKRTSFYLVTKPVEAFPGYTDCPVIRAETQTPYYLRSTRDKRLFICGGESLLASERGRISRVLHMNRLFDIRYQEMEQKLSEMFCGIPKLEAEYRYAGYLPKTGDTLPVFGYAPGRKNIYLHYTAGVNRAVQAEIGSRLLLQLYLEGRCPDLALFSAERETV